MTSQEAWRTGRHVIYRLHVHLVFITKYRRGVITDRVHRILEDSMRKVCADFECELLTFETDYDHARLLVAYPPKVSISTLTNSLKGVSARMIRKTDFPEVRRALCGQHFWSPSYCAVSCGGDPLQVVKQYVESQREPNKPVGSKKRRVPNQ